MGSAFVSRLGGSVACGEVSADTMFRITIPASIGKKNIVVGICDSYNPSGSNYKIIAFASVVDGVNEGAYWRETDGLMVANTQFTFDNEAGLMRSTATSTSEGKPMFAGDAKYYYVTW